MSESSPLGDSDRLGGIILSDVVEKYKDKILVQVIVAFFGVVSWASVKIFHLRPGGRFLNFLKEYLHNHKGRPRNNLGVVSLTCK